MQQSLFKVRDRRKKGWFYLDNEYLNGLGKYFGPVGIAVYVALCRHADHDQRCFPAQELIAEETGVTPRTVIKYIKLLEKHNVIAKDRQRKHGGKWLNNTYYLLDKSEWIYPSELSSHGDNQVKQKTSPSEINSSSHVKQFHTKDTNTNKTNRNNTNRGETPSQTAQRFFNSLEEQQSLVTRMAERGIDQDWAEREIHKFVSYWTELNKSGTKQRWQQQPTFEVERRIRTWVEKSVEFNKTKQRNIII